MIRIARGREPKGLTRVRRLELLRVRQLIKALGRPPNSQDLGTKYQLASDALWRAQHFKCCYCELKEQQRRNDVEHFRPKARANRSPGSSELHGYWWLAWTWKNLFFSCRNCNQSPAKVDKFPLAKGSTALRPEQVPEGKEHALLINPARESGIAHIQFRPMPAGGRTRWVPVARSGSEKGLYTIRTCQLDNDGHLDLYADHAERIVVPRINRVQKAQPARVMTEWAEALELLRPSWPLVGLSWDMLDHSFDVLWRTRRGLTLPMP